MEQSRLERVRSDAEFEQFIGEFTSYERMSSFRYDDATLKLARMESFAAALGDPHLRYPTIHVAGTKGKGTTCLLLEALLSRTHPVVGTYTSPHIEHLRERIRVGGASIGETELCSELNEVLPVLNECRERGEACFPTFFELMTGLAMSHFERRRVRYGIFEVGLGGRLDATNILRPAVTAITSIGLEHMQKLGSTLAAIAREKAGIVKPGAPLILGRLPSEAREVALEVAAARGASVVEVAEDAVTLERDGSLRLLEVPGAFRPGPVRGPGLRDDLGVAVALWKTLLEVDGLAPSAEHLQTTLDELTLPARIELVAAAPPLVIDGAHTAESIRTLRLGLEEIDFPRPRAALVSISSDKRIDAMLDELVPLADTFYFTSSDATRSVDPASLAARLLERHGRDVPAGHTDPDPRRALAKARADGWPLVVTGSIYLAGTVRSAVISSPRRACES